LCGCVMCDVCVLPKDGICLLRSEQFIKSDPQEHKSHFLINELVSIVSAEYAYTECTVLFNLTRTWYPTYFARLQFLHMKTNCSLLSYLCVQAESSHIHSSNLGVQRVREMKLAQVSLGIVFGKIILNINAQSHIVPSVHIVPQCEVDPQYLGVAAVRT
jgi:hypothetical protein